RRGGLRHRPDPLGVWRSHDALGAILAAPDFVIIGHVTLDRFGEVTRPGGAVLYAAVAAHRLGLSVGLLTSHGNDFPLDAIPTRIEVVSVPARETTRFEHRYESAAAFPTSRAARAR